MPESRGPIPTPVEAASSDGLHPLVVPFTAVAVTLVTFAAIILVRPGAFFFDDFQSQYVPAYVDIARSLREGNFPLVSPYAWFGGALAGEYQYGVFSAFLLPLVGVVGSLGLSPAWLAGALSAVHLAVLSCGCSVLARSRGSSSWAAVLVATAIPFGGFFFSWGVANWFPMATSFAWVPWAVWASFRAAAEPSQTWRASLAGVFVYLVLTGGWPFTGASLLILLAFHSMAACLERRSLRPLLPFIITWTIGGLLSAPALLMLLQHAFDGDRLRVAADAGKWATPLDAFLGWFAPSLPVDWVGFARGSVSGPAFELFLGIAVPALVVTRLSRSGVVALRRLLPELGLVILFATLSTFCEFGPLRWPFRWIPFESLALGLLVARLESTALFRNGPGRLAAPLSATAFTAIVVPLVAVVGGTALQIGVAVSLFSLSAVWSLFAWRTRAAAIGWEAVLASSVSLVIVHTCLPNPHHLPSWAEASPSEARRLFSADRLYVSLHRMTDAYGSPLEGMDRALVHLGNQGMLEGRRWINGYSPIAPRGIRSWFDFGWSGFTGDEADGRWRDFMSRGGLFDVIGISGVVLPAFPSRRGLPVPWPPPDGTWRLAVETTRFRLFERDVVPPSVRSVPGVRFVGDASVYASDLPVVDSSPAVPIQREMGSREPSPELEVIRLEVLEDTRLAARVRLPGGRTRWTGLVFSRPFFEGYRARFMGRDLHVAAAYGIAPFVLVPPGESGELELFYRPAALRYGALAAGLGILGILVTVHLRRRNGSATWV